MLCFHCVLFSRSFGSIKYKKFRTFSPSFLSILYSYTYNQKYHVDRKPSNQKTRNLFPNAIKHEAIWYHRNNREYNNCPDESMETDIIKEIWETRIFWTTINLDKIGYIFHGIIFIMEYGMFWTSNWNESRNNNHNSQNQTMV